tara:strand:+ start:381 stop:737 length:357 start_codon:yes stop_codon:yes gene_type:complete
MRADFLFSSELKEFPRRLVAAGENICLPGKKAEIAFVIEKGQAKICGQRKKIFCGDVIGLIDLISEQNYLDKIVATNNCRLICFSRDQIKKSLNKQSKVLWPIAKLLAIEIFSFKEVA